MRGDYFFAENNIKPFSCHMSENKGLKNYSESSMQHFFVYLCIILPFTKHLLMFQSIFL